MRITRRSVLKGLAAAPLVSCAGRQVQAPLLELVQERIKTVVFLMMENRSFDHLFGSYSLVEGRADIDGYRADMKNELTDGTPIFPARAELMCHEDPAHGFNPSHDQFNGGLNDGFVREHEERYGADVAHRVMAYLERDQAPASYALADNYALCQRWFCSVMGPTWPNRYYSILATSNGNKSNVPIEQPLASTFTRLDSKLIKWKQYYGNLPFSALLPGFSIEQPEFQTLETFFDDAAAGTLPPYVHLDPIYGNNDDHPPAHPLAGQILLLSIFKALAQSPQWGECLFVVTYDEHGGFYDHVPPPTTADSFEEFRQMGFRVPSLVIGPYVKPQVSSTVFDHTSVIATVLRQHELEPLNERDAAANDLWPLLDIEALAAGAAAAAVDVAPIEADDDVIHAEECRGFDIPALHMVPGAHASTGQPELEAWFDAHPSSKDGRAGAASAWARILRRARELGAIR